MCGTYSNYADSLGDYSFVAAVDGYATYENMDDSSYTIEFATSGDYVPLFPHLLHTIVNFV